MFRLVALGGSLQMSTPRKLQREIPRPPETLLEAGIRGDDDGDHGRPFGLP